MMKKPTFEEIIRDIKNIPGAVVFTVPYSMNLGGYRTKDNEANTYNDWLFMFYYDEKNNIKGIITPGTVDAGLTYRVKPMNKNGTAIIKHDMQHRGVYEYQNPKVNNPKLKKEGKPLELGHNGNEAFRQVKDMTYWRDNDKNKFIGESKDVPNFEKYPTEISNSSTNGHDMGYTNVNGNSAGCWGSSPENMDKFYDLAKLQISKGLGKRFSFTLIKEK